MYTGKIYIKNADKFHLVAATTQDNGTRQKQTSHWPPSGVCHQRPRSTLDYMLG